MGVRRAVPGAAAPLLGTVLVACGLAAGTTKPAPPVVGGVYSISGDSGRCGIVKVLAMDSGAVHIRLYANRYPDRPQRVALDSLRLGRIGEAGGFGIGHLPLSPDHFAAWQPLLVTRTSVTSVTDDEPAGYREWKVAGGGVFRR